MWKTRPWASAPSIITIDDSIQAPDLSKIRVEGYEIENAVFVEEMGRNPSGSRPTTWI